MTAAAGTAAMFEQRVEPGRIASFVLAAAVHLALLAVLVLGVRWQNRPPEAVQVELWNEPAPVQAPVEPKPVPVAEPMVAKPEPVIPKPEIVEKAPPPKPKPVPKVEPKPKPEPVARKPRDEEIRRQIREQLNREQAALAIDRERQQMKDQLAREATAARNRSMADWADKVRSSIRGKIVLPPGIQGNPEAIFDVVLLPNREVLSLKLRKSSGHAALDDAIERAIRKASPLPKPEGNESAPRTFELKYRPLDPL